jgi:hypothetical protein
MAIVFNGTSQYLSWASGVINHNADYTVLLHFYPTTFAGGARNLFCVDAGNADERNTDTVFVTSTGAAAIYCTDSVGAQTFGGDSGATVLSTNTWYHLAFVRSGNTVTVYINGVSYLSGTASVSGRGSATAMSLAAFQNNAYKDYFAGRIDNVHIYATALSVDQINAQARMRRPQASPWLWLPTTDVAIASAVVDYSGNGRSPTATNTPTIADGAGTSWGRADVPMLLGTAVAPTSQPFIPRMQNTPYAGNRAQRVGI